MDGGIIELRPAEAAFIPQTFLGIMYEWGIELIRVIQSIQNPVLTSLMKFITTLGSEVLYFPLILFIFWWIDEKRGLRFGILIVLSAWINVFMKDILKHPRPFHIDPSLGLVTMSSYGAPSGHAQLALCFWIPMAAWLEKIRPARRSIIWTTAICFILLIGFTRLYLGVHFPTDLLAGFLLGGIILLIYFTAGPLIEKYLSAGGIRFQNIAIALMALTMNGLFPQERAFPALFLGFCLGYTLMKQRFPFAADGEINGKKPGAHIMLLRCLVGFAGAATLFLALGLILPGEGSLFGDMPIWGAASPFYDIGRFIQYGLLGFWATAGAPRLFQRVGLAR